VLGCFFFLISCQQTEKEKLEELVKNWNGKEVLFPTNPSFTLYGKTPVDFKIPVSDYKIVTYVDRWVVPAVNCNCLNGRNL
jgi:hypothetical protein